MDFVVGLPLTRRKHDSVWVVVDQLTKSSHFLPMRTDYSLDKLEELYIKEIVGCMGFQYPLFQTEIQGLPPDFGKIARGFRHSTEF